MIFYSFVLCQLLPFYHFSLMTEALTISLAFIMILPGHFVLYVKYRESLIVYTLLHGRKTIKNSTWEAHSLTDTTEAQAEKQQWGPSWAYKRTVIETLHRVYLFLFVPVSPQVSTRCTSLYSRFTTSFGRLHLPLCCQNSF